MTATTWEGVIYHLVDSFDRPELWAGASPRDALAEIAAHVDQMAPLVQRQIGGSVMRTLRADFVQILRWALAGGADAATPRIFSTRDVYRQRLLDIANIAVGKQHDYGHKNIATFGMQGIIVRLNDKVARLENMLGHGQAAHHEGIEDTWVDIVGYSLIALMWIDGTFLNPLARDVVEA